MTKTATARARIEPAGKEEAEKILRDCGLTASQAISLFYRRVILERGLPFPVRSFNEETSDWLRIHRIEGDVITFERTGPHSDLFEE